MFIDDPRVAPPPGAEIDWNHPLSQGLFIACSFQPESPINAASSIAVTASNIQYVPGEYGTSLLIPSDSSIFDIPYTGREISTNSISFIASCRSSLSRPFTGIIFSRSSANSFGMHYGSNNNLGYTWNNQDLATWGWDSGVSIPVNQNNFLALAIQPNSAYLRSNLTELTRLQSHIFQSVLPVTRIGADAANSNRTFQGVIHYAYVHIPALSPSLINWIYSEPFAMWMNPSNRLFFL